MTQAQRKTASKAAAKAGGTTTRSRRTRTRRIEFIASVRFFGGDTELFSVSNAKTPEEARDMVLAEICNVATVLVAERHWRY